MYEKFELQNYPNIRIDWLPFVVQFVVYSHQYLLSPSQFTHFRFCTHKFSSIHSVGRSVANCPRYEPFDKLFISFDFVIEIFAVTGLAIFICQRISVCVLDTASSTQYGSIMPICAQINFASKIFCLQIQIDWLRFILLSLSLDATICNPVGIVNNSFVDFIQHISGLCPFSTSAIPIRLLAILSNCAYTQMQMKRQMKEAETGKNSINCVIVWMWVRNQQQHQTLYRYLCMGVYVCVFVWYTNVYNIVRFAH